MFKVKPILAAMLIVMLAASRPAPTQAEPLTAISATVQLTATLLSFLDSGANPYGVAAVQNRQMIKSVHERLSGYDAAFKVILGRFDDLPGTVRQEIDQSLDIDQIRSVRAAIQLIESDLNAYKQMLDVDPSNHPTPIADASLRLQTLQQEAQKLLNHDSDLILLDALAAMHTEMAMLAMQPGYNDAQLSAAIGVRKMEYHRRFGEMLIPWDGSSKENYESLTELMRKTEEQLRISTDALDSLLSRNYKFYFDCMYPDNYPCGEIEITWICAVNIEKVKDGHRLYKSILSTVEDVEITLEMYEKMYQIVTYELDLSPSDDRVEELGLYGEQANCYKTKYTDFRKVLEKAKSLKSYMDFAITGVCPGEIPK